MSCENWQILPVENCEKLVNKDRERVRVRTKIEREWEWEIPQTRKHSESHKSINIRKHSEFTAVESKQIKANMCEYVT